MPEILYEKKVSLKVPQSTEKFSVENPLALFPIEVIPGDFTDELDDEVRSDCSSRIDSYSDYFPVER